MPKPLVPIINWGNPVTRGLFFDIPFFERGGNPSEIIYKQGTTVTGAKWINALSGPAMSFSGGASTDNVLTIASYSGTTYRTIETLFYINATDTTSRRIFEWANEGAGGNLFDQILVDTTNLFQYQIGYASTENWKISLPSVGMWHHLVITHDGSSTGIAPIIYLDGISQTVTNVTTGTGALATGSNQIRIGNRFDVTRAWNGYVGYLRRWNRILNAQEIRQLYSNPWSIYRGVNLLPFQFGSMR